MRYRSAVGHGSTGVSCLGLQVLAVHASSRKTQLDGPQLPVRIVNTVDLLKLGVIAPLNSLWVLRVRMLSAVQTVL